MGVRRRGIFDQYPNVTHGRDIARKFYPMPRFLKRDIVTQFQNRIYAETRISKFASPPAWRWPRRTVVITIQY